MPSGLLELAVAFAVGYGAYALFVVFLLEGALVGKLVPTRSILLAVLLALGTELVALLPAAAAAVLGATVGQLLLFAVVRRRGVRIEELRWVPVEQRQLSRADRWLDRWGLPAVVISNALPVTRGYLTPPLAASDVPGYQFSACSLLGSVLYIGALVTLATGLDVLV